jgi:hypothetical protein
MELWTIARSSYGVGMTEMGGDSIVQHHYNYVIGLVLTWCQIVVLSASAGANRGLRIVKTHGVATHSVLVNTTGLS